MRFWKSLSTRSKALLVLMILATVASGILRQHRGDGYDFAAYFRGARLWLHGKNPYTYFTEFNFKYAPSSLLLFTPFALLRYEIARWVYLFVHLVLTLSTPVLLWKFVALDKKSERFLKPNAYINALFIAYVGTLRFIDEEYWLSQFGLPIFWGVLFGNYLLLKAQKNGWISHVGVFVASLFAQVKIHSLLTFASYFRVRKPRAWLPIAVVATLPLLLPNPHLWRNWAHLMHQSTRDISFGPNLQGFFAFTELVMGWGQSSARTFYLIIPCFLLLFWKLPRFSVDEARRKPLALLLTIFAWMLFGISTSLLPWRYSYSVVWAFFALSWLSGLPRERKIVLALCLLLGLTPSGIVTHKISLVLEHYQFVFLVMMLELIMLVKQARRYAF